MKKEKFLIVDKWFLDEHYHHQVEKLNEMFGGDWYVKHLNSIYALVVGECQMSFISSKGDFVWIVDGIEFWLLLAKHWK